MGKYGSVWGSIEIKAGKGGAGNVTAEEKNSIISSAVDKWMRMGLTNRQIAFGIAAMNVESGFNPEARNPDPTSTASGLGQFTDGTWNKAVTDYNNTFNDDLNPNLDKDTDSQIAVMGSYILTVWDKAETVSNDPRLTGLTQPEIAYGMWHEGYGTFGNVENVAGFLNNDTSNGFTPDAQYFFHSTYDYVSEVSRNVLMTGVPIQRLDLLDRVSREQFFRDHPDVAGSFGNLGHNNATRGETLRREGNHVYRVETDGSTRGFFISE